jgi:hypothetical protein
MRIPVLFNTTPEPDDATLVEDGHDMPATGYAIRFTATQPGHIIGCTCCTLRGPAADALGQMFAARARGQAPYFHRVIVLASPAGEAAIRQALAGDVVCAARFKQGEGLRPLDPRWA